MDGPGRRWLPLHGTPLAPQVWDGAAGHMRRYGAVWAGLAPVAPLFAEGVAYPAVLRGSAAGERGRGVRQLRRGHNRSCLWVDIGGEGRSERARVEVEVSALGPVRPGVWHGPDRGGNEAAVEAIKESCCWLSPSSHIQPLR